jgi:hypothetical protein
LDSATDDKAALRMRAQLAREALLANIGSFFATQH